MSFPALDSMTITLPALATVVTVSVSWAITVAGAFFNLRGRIIAGETRMADISKRLEDGKAKFAVLEDHRARDSERIARIETIIPTMDKKLDQILERIG